jgi:ABC-type polysaccharide/polyol phosphate export permease
MLFSAFTIYYQKNSSLVSTLYHLTKTFTGIVFPVSMLSGFPLVLSKSLPLSYGLSTLQSILFSSSLDFKGYLFNCLILVSLSIVIGLKAWILFSYSMKNAKKHGKGDWY